MFISNLAMLDSIKIVITSKRKINFTVYFQIMDKILN